MYGLSGIHAAEVGEGEVEGGGGGGGALSATPRGGGAGPFKRGVLNPIITVLGGSVDLFLSIRASIGTGLDGEGTQPSSCFRRRRAMYGLSGTSAAREGGGGGTRSACDGLIDASSFVDGFA